jgi:hypothetical protein
MFKSTGGGYAMSGPFIFIATNRLKPGKLEAERRRVPGLVEFIEANEPRLIAFHEYANDQGTEVGVVQVHPDADSFEFHMGVVRERGARAYEETLDATTSIQVFGEPTEKILEMLKRAAGGGVEFTVKEHHLGGFTRSEAAPPP